MVVIFTKIYILPIIIFVWFPVTFLVTYIIALNSKDIVVFVPYVSDTGTYSPESCIFGQMLNTGSILMAMVMYVRYRHIQEISNLYSLPYSVQSINKFCLWLGLTATFGVSLVGNFQETNIFSMHVIGACIAFGLGTVYQVLQTLLCLRMYPKLGCNKVNYCRIAISGCCFVSSIITVIFAGISLMAFDGDDMTKWTSQHGGYKAHVVSAITEWITVILTMAYILTLAYEFKTITIYEPEMEFVHEEIKFQSEGNRY